MTISLCTYKAIDCEPYASAVIIKIEIDTTPEAFDQILAQYPDYRLSYGGLQGWTALGKAALYGNTPLIHHIVRKGGTHLLHLGDYVGRTPLHYSTHCQDREKGFLAAKALLSLGSNINTAPFSPTSDDNMTTPLWYAAVRTQNLKLVKLLLIYGGAIHPDTADGMFDYATNEQCRPHTLINRAREDLKKDAEKWTAFNMCNRQLTVNKLPKEIVEIIGHYFQGDMAIPNLKAKPVADPLQEGTPWISRIISWLPRLW